MFHQVREDTNSFYNLRNIFSDYECNKRNKSISIPNLVESIGNFAYNHCDELESVIFSNGSFIEFIGIRAFSYCKNFELIIIPKSIKSIEDYAFYYCDKLKSVLFSNESLVK